MPRINEFRRQLIASVIRTGRRRLAGSRIRANSDPLNPFEVVQFLGDGAEADEERGQPTPDEYVFVDPAGAPLSHEWLHKRVWLVTSPGPR